jgi:hypothetical protein
VGGLIDRANVRATHSRDAGLFSVDCKLDGLDRRHRIGGLCGVGSISILLRAENGSHEPLIWFLTLWLWCGVEFWAWAERTAELEPWPGAWG